MSVYGVSWDVRRESEDGERERDVLSCISVSSPSLPFASLTLPRTFPVVVSQASSTVFSPSSVSESSIPCSSSFSFVFSSCGPLVEEMCFALEVVSTGNPVP